MNALNIAEYSNVLGIQAKAASALMARAPSAVKNKALKALARLLRENVGALQVGNARDLDRARAVAQEAGLQCAADLGPACGSRGDRGADCSSAALRRIAARWSRGWPRGQAI